MRKDFVTAKERLGNSWHKQIFDDVCWTVCCFAMAMFFIFELTREVAYVY